MNKQKNTADRVVSTHEKLVVAFIVITFIFIVLKVVFL